VTIGIRPEDMIVAPVGPGKTTLFVDLVEDLGADGFVHGHYEDGGADVVARVDSENYPELHSQVSIEAKTGHVHLFDPASGERISSPVLVG